MPGPASPSARASAAPASSFPTGVALALTDSPQARTHDLSSIRVCVSGAMALPVEVQEQFERISGARLVDGYGIPETSPSTHCNPVVGSRRAGSVGLPLPGTLAKVVDRDDATREVRVGEPGELAVKGPQVFQGYWGHDSTEGVFTDGGYLLTGDVAVMDEAGFFFVVDRKKELIIAGGFTVYPSEVEEVLSRLPGVADGAVVGVPDRYRGETVKAFVVRAPGGADLTEADVVEHCKRELAAYKVPKVVEFLDELPRSAVGKVLRRVLVEQERAKAAAATEPPVTKAAATRAPAKASVARKAPTTPAASSRGTGADLPETDPVPAVPATQAPGRKPAARKPPVRPAPRVVAEPAPPRPRAPRKTTPPAER